MRSVRCVTWARPSVPGLRGRRDPADRLTREALDDVAFLEVVEVRQGDAALEVGGDLANIVPEATERLDPVGCDDLATAPNTGPTTNDPALGHDGAGDDLVAAHLDQLPHLGSTLDDLDDFGLEQALERGLDVVRE